MITPEELFREHLSMADTYKGSDWYSNALEGLWDACNGWVRQRAPFKNWARIKITGYVLDAKRSALPVSRRGHHRGVTVEPFADLQPSPLPDPESALLEKRRASMLRRAVLLTDPAPRALLLASLNEEEHQDAARSLGLSKSWASRLNAKAEAALAKRLAGRV